jgi:membrane-associated phospholipid phosphatase
MHGLLDHDILLAIYSFATANQFFVGLSVFFAEWFPYLVVGSVVVYEFFARDAAHHALGSIIRTIVPAFLAWLFVSLIKYAHPLGRPFTEDIGIIPLISVDDPFGSFPSGHAGMFAALAGAMLGNRFHGWKWYLLATFVIAIARVAVGVHFPSDVLAGLVIGFFIGFFIARPLAIVKKW